MCVLQTSQNMNEKQIKKKIQNTKTEFKKVDKQATNKEYVLKD